MNSDFLMHEMQYWKGGGYMAGADEAGRGPLAGPVVAAAVIFPKECVIEGINDSKKLTEKKREQLYEEIITNSIYSVGIVDAQEIDATNILIAARKAFHIAAAGLSIVPNFFYTDFITKLDLPSPYEAIVKGDAKVYSIAAASIVAKVTRDRMMRDYALQYPEYGFEKHKGYGTKLHYQALKEFGPSPIHRKTFLKKLYED